MNLLDAKVINTQYGLETYLDSISNIKVTELQSPTSDYPFYEIKVGVEYLLLNNRKHYDYQKHYFWIRMSQHLKSISLIEPDIESLFAVKSEIEREATKDLVGEWIINTNAFKQAIHKMIHRIKGESNKKDTLGTIGFLERLLQIKTEDIKNAPIEKCS